MLWERIGGDFTPHFISLERSEECEQSVVGFKSRCGLASGSQFLQGLLLNEQVGLNVAMRSLNVLIAPATRRLLRCPRQTGADEKHMYGAYSELGIVTKHVRRDAFAAECRGALY